MEYGLYVRLVITCAGNLLIKYMTDYNIIHYNIENS